MSNHQGFRRLKDLMFKSENRVCADCGAPDPKWASANVGVFICLKCSSVHRSLGPHISKVLSVTLDEWSEDEIESIIDVGGNSAANAIYEASFPNGFSKPGPNASNDERLNFIRSKYERQEFLKPSLRITSFASGRSSHASFSRRILDSFLDINISKKTENNEEVVGFLKVKVIKGTDLAIRDILTSDPYVILKLGQQKVQTTVVKSNLNPVWNEILTLSIPENCGSVKLQVFDHDMFSADDIMGEAEIDIQPLVTAATAYGDISQFGNMQVGKWLKSNDNALIDDSIINIVDGKVRQEVLLKLQNVECGELQLELEWIPLDQ